MNKRVVIAAGHWPLAPGAQYFGLSEHDEALKVVGHLGKILRALGYEPVTVAGPLGMKTGAANAADALCAVEVHFNASTNPTADGCETLYGSDPHDKPLAEAIQKALVARLRIRDRGTKFADYAGTVDTVGECAWTRLIKCPAAIVEPLFLSNAQEAGRLQGELAEHAQIAAAIAEGIRGWELKIED